MTQENRISKKVSLQIIPNEIIETLEQKALDNIKPLDLAVKERHLTVIALVFFLVCLIIFLYLY